MPGQGKRMSISRIQRLPSEPPDCSQSKTARGCVEFSPPESHIKSFGILPTATVLTKIIPYIHPRGAGSTAIAYRYCSRLVSSVLPQVSGCFAFGDPAVLE